MKEHIPQPVEIDKIIGEVWAQVKIKSADAMLSAGINDIFYYHDTITKIEARLLIKDSVQAFKYPALFLFHPFTEDLGGAGGYYGKITIPRMAIAMNNSDINSFADMRDAKTFNPVLNPLFGWFRRALSQHPKIVENDPNEITMRKVKHYFWGQQQAGTTLTDYLDGIEILNTKFTVTQNC